MDPKWIKVGIGIASLVIGAVGGGVPTYVATKNYRMANETALKDEVTNLKNQVAKLEADARNERYVVTYNGKDCSYRKK